jgi:hypothetical protein
MTNTTTTDARHLFPKGLNREGERALRYLLAVNGDAGDKARVRAIKRAMKAKGFPISTAY